MLDYLALAFHYNRVGIERLLRFKGEILIKIKITLDTKGDQEMSRKEMLFDTLKTIIKASLEKNDEYTVEMLYEDMKRDKEHVQVL